MSLEEKIKFLKDNGVNETTLARKEKKIKNVNYDDEYFCSLIIDDDSFLEKEIGVETILNMIEMFDDIEEFEELNKDGCNFKGTSEQLSLVLDSDKEKLLSFGYRDIVLKKDRGYNCIYFSAKRLETEEEYINRIDENVKNAISKKKRQEKKKQKKLEKEKKLYEQLKKKFEPELYVESSSQEDRAARLRKTLWVQNLRSKYLGLNENN